MEGSVLPDWSPPGHRDHLNLPSLFFRVTTATTPSYTTIRPSLLSFLESRRGLRIRNRILSPDPLLCPESSPLSSR